MEVTPLRWQPSTGCPSSSTNFDATYAALRLAVRECVLLALAFEARDAGGQSSGTLARFFFKASAT